MAHPYHHALASVQRWGGMVSDYQPIHDWFDATKAMQPDPRHRALRHHAEGIFLCEQLFGTTITNSDGRVIPVRWVGEQHVKKDLGWIPSAQDWLRELPLRGWMLHNRRSVGQDADEPGSNRQRQPKGSSG